MARHPFLPADTDLEAREVQTCAYRRMGGKGRTGVMFRLTAMASENALAGIRERHPDYDEESVRIALFRLRYGDELARLVFPDREIPEP